MTGLELLWDVESSRLTSGRWAAVATLPRESVAMNWTDPPGTFTVYSLGWASFAVIGTTPADAEGKLRALLRMSTMPMGLG